MAEIITQVKKRGRKPKNKLVENKKDITPINTEEEAIIAHLPISLEDIDNNSDNEDTNSDENNIFIKSE